MTNERASEAGEPGAPSAGSTPGATGATGASGASGSGLPDTPEAPAFSAPYELFMLGLCTLVLAGLAVELLWDLDAETSRILFVADTAIALVFMGDFLVTLAKADDRPRYLLTWGWIDFLSSIPMAGPLRVGRAARVARIIRIFRVVRSTRVLMGFVARRRAESAFLAVLFTTVLVVVFGSIAVLHLERAAGGNIQTAADALWWSAVAVSTAGFGDFYPISGGGRLVAAFMMVCGIGLFGTLTAFIATWFMAPSERDQDRDLARLLEEVEELRRDVRRGAETSARPPP